MKACARRKALPEGRQVHALMFQSRSDSDIFLANNLVDMYSKCGSVEDARRVFDKIRERNVFSWTAMIAGYAQNELGEEALALYEQMKREGVQANKVTFSAVLNACAMIPALEQGKLIHSCILKAGFRLDMILQNTLVDMYAKCGCVEVARELFNSMRERDVISWNAMISGYAQNGLGNDALVLYEQMQQEGGKADIITFVAVLKACASLAALEKGKQFHSLILRGGFKLDVILHSALVDMYAKCGCLETARELFNKMSERNVVSWNAIIAGYAHNGLGMEALALYEHMKQEGMQPNKVTHICVLSALSHSGLVEEACRVFDSMFKCSDFTPSLDHYACMVDILGRARCLERAENFIIKMPIQPNAVVWMSLLGAARNHGDVETGRRAFDQVVKLEPEKIEPYLLLIDIYVGAGRMDEVAEIRKEMVHKGLKNLHQYSWIELDNQVHTFGVGDGTHPQSAQIWSKLKGLLKIMKKAGYTPELSSVLDDVNDDEKEVALLMHSEKLAIAFGLLSIPPEGPIRIRTNVRVCRDCHNATKIISKIVGREINMMDANQFHRFKDGLCSCRDYW